MLAPATVPTDSRRLVPAAPDGRDTRGASLSQQLWGIDWREWLPRTVTDDGIVVTASDVARAEAFIEREYPMIFHHDEGPSRFRAGAFDERRRRYYAAVGDFFEFTHDGGTVAVLIGTPVDWGTYYLRSAAALPRYQGRAVVQRFLPFLFARLAEGGVERVEADAAPANFASLQHLLRMRFNVTGTVLSERWGALVRLTKMLDRDSEAVFLRQFCDGVPQARGV